MISMTRRSERYMNLFKSGNKPPGRTTPVKRQTWEKRRVAEPVAENPLIRKQNRENEKKLQKFLNERNLKLMKITFYKL